MTNSVWQMVLDHYGGIQDVASVLGVSRQAVHQEIKRGKMPVMWARRLHIESDGRIHVLTTKPEVFAGIVA